WPDLESDVAESCRILADHLDRYRQLHDVTPSVAEEETLHATVEDLVAQAVEKPVDRKSTRLNSSHVSISYAVFCLKKKINCYILPLHKSKTAFAGKGLTLANKIGTATLTAEICTPLFR